MRIKSCFQKELYNCFFEELNLFATRVSWTVKKSSREATAAGAAFQSTVGAKSLDPCPAYSRKMGGGVIAR
jgi:hypothetical protein